MDKTNPFLRALAVRTMGCIRVKEIVEYLLDPLSRAIKDDVIIIINIINKH